MKKRIIRLILVLAATALDNANCKLPDAVKRTFCYDVFPGGAPADPNPTLYVYNDAVRWAKQNGITSGISDGLFGSTLPCTRAQIVTFLYRAFAE